MSSMLEHQLPTFLLNFCFHLETTWKHCLHHINTHL